MSATASQIVNDALQMLGVYNPGDPVQSGDMITGLSVMNDMLDSWSNENLMVYANQSQAIQLASGVSQYTLGPGGTGGTTRPLSIPPGPGQCYIQDNTGSNYDVQVIDEAIWNQIGLKTNNSDIPDTLWYDPQYPLGVINLFPVPAQPYVLYITATLQLTDFANLQQAISLPPGYKLAITTNLAVALHPYFLEGEINKIIALRASQSRGNVKRTNQRVMTAQYDPEIVSRASPTYNIYRDRSNGT